MKMVLFAYASKYGFQKINKMQNKLLLMQIKLIKILKQSMIKLVINTNSFAYLEQCFSFA